MLAAEAAGDVLTDTEKQRSYGKANTKLSKHCGSSEMLHANFCLHVLGGTWWDFVRRRVFPKSSAVYIWHRWRALPFPTLPHRCCSRSTTEFVESLQE